jgi:hypothetical protein
MKPTEQTVHAPFLPGAAALGLMTIYLIALLAVERQALIIGLLGIAIAGVLAIGWRGLLAPVGRSFAEHENAFGALTLLAACVVAAAFHDNHFVLLLVVTVLLNSVTPASSTSPARHSSASAPIRPLCSPPTPPCHTCWCCRSPGSRPR